MWLLNKSLTKSSSRNQIAIKEVTDGVLVLPNNQYRMVLETSSVNFELKSEAEQDVLIENFQSFLNSLPCSIQILVRVREMDIDHYLDTISQSLAHETHDVYKQQIENYKEFVSSLVHGNKILARHFYIVVLHSASKSDEFELVKEQLSLTSDVVIKGLERMGMKASPLQSIEILKSFYSFYNPQQSKTQELTEIAVNQLLN